MSDGEEIYTQVYIGFSKPRHWLVPFSWAIRAVERTRYSHVLLAWSSPVTQVPVIYEASGSSLRFLYRKIFDKKNEIIETYKVDVTRAQYRQLVKWCMTNAGVEYGVKQIIGILLQRIFRLKKNPLSEGRKSQVCSELVGAVLEQVFGKELNLNLDIAGPRDIREWCVNNLKRV